MSTGGSRTIGRAAALLSVAAGLAACTGAQAHPSHGSGALGPAPAQAAGGACQLLDYNAVAGLLGTRFDVAAAAQQGDTFTCVLVRSVASYPDLSLAVTPTAADATVYRATVQPAAGTAVPDLGAVAYSAPIAALGADSGPGVEVGWLSGNGRLITLQYRFAAKATDADVAAATPKLVALARKVDESSL